VSVLFYCLYYLGLFFLFFYNYFFIYQVLCSSFGISGQNTPGAEVCLVSSFSQTYQHFLGKVLSDFLSIQPSQFFSEDCFYQRGLPV